MNYSLYKTADNAESTLDSSISASDLTIVLNDASSFPATINGSATSGGDATTLNCTGIQALGVAVGDFIENLTDGSHAFILSVSTNSVTTTTLQGGSGNTWDASDSWVVGQFIGTLSKRNATTGAITTSEKVKVQQRSSNTLTVATGGRGFDGSTAQAFDAGDYFSLFVVSQGIEDIIKGIAEQATDIKGLQDTAPSALEKIALARLLDFDLTYSGASLNVTVAPGVYDNSGSSSSSTPLTLTGSSTNYIEVNQTTGVVSANTTSFNPTTSLALWQVTTDGSGVTAVSDERQVYGDFPGNSTTPTKIASSFTAGEAITENDACYVTNLVDLIDISSPDSDYAVFGGTASSQSRAQSFQLAEALTISALKLRVKKVGSPTDNLTIRIETNSGSTPSGTLVDANATGTYDLSTLSTSYADITINLAAAISLSVSTTYWVVVYRDGGNDGTNYPVIEGKSTGGYANGDQARNNSGTWFNQSPADFTYLSLVSSVAKAYQASTTSDLTKKFIGFANADASSGASVELTIGGVMAGFSGLTIGSLYILSGTGGQITTSGANPYTGEILVGYAISSSQILIKNLDFTRSV